MFFCKKIDFLGNFFGLNFHFPAKMRGSMRGSMRGLMRGLMRGSKMLTMNADNYL